MNKPVRQVAIAAKSQAVEAKKTVKAPARKAAPATKAPAAAKPVVATVKVVRDSFTMTQADHDLLKSCKRDAIAGGRDNAKKSEIVRAALRCFAALSVADRMAAIGKLAPIKTGRPEKARK